MHTGTQIQFATASDGTPLHWLIKAPGTGKYPGIVGIHGGGFHKGNDNTPISVCGADTAAAGFVMFSPEYRLAPPGSIIGQTSSGKYPDQTNDIQLAIDAARIHPLCNGSVQLLGGSAGAYFAAWFAAMGVASGVGMSPATQLDASGNSTFVSDCNNYAGPPPGNLIVASPNTHFIATSKAFFLRAYTDDNMPANQYQSCLDQMIAVGVEHDAKLLSGKGHAFDMWGLIKTEALAWLSAHK
jgi:acetyl esterase/lipase